MTISYRAGEVEPFILNSLLLVSAILNFMILQILEAHQNGRSKILKIDRYG